MASDEELLKRYNNLYLEILMRYREYVEEKERLYVADLPKLITPSDESVLAVAKRIESTFPSYAYEQNFLDAAKLALEYVRNEIASIKMPLQVWLKPSETIRLGAGDVFDKAALLCSLLISLGNFSAKVVSIARSGEGRFVIYFEYEGHVFFTDMENGFEGLQSKEELLSRIGPIKGEDADAYEFNDKMYNDVA